MVICHLISDDQELTIELSSNDQSNWGFGHKITFPSETLDYETKEYKKEMVLENREILPDLFVYPTQKIALQRAIQSIDCFFDQFILYPERTSLYLLFQEWNISDPVALSVLS